MAKTILVIDDEFEVQRLLRLLFERAGYAVVVAPNMAAAKTMIVAQPVDVVVVDDLMPGCSGLEFCAWLNATAELRHIPVILLSAGPERLSKDTLAEVGAFAALRKPAPPRQLLDVVASCFAARV